MASTVIDLTRAIVWHLAASQPTLDDVESHCNLINASLDDEENRYGTPGKAPSA